LLAFAWIGGWFRFLTLVVIGFALLSTTPVMLTLVQEHARSSFAAAKPKTIALCVLICYSAFLF
jgi:FSR family fosmidomycin resistance protein-like MFS transporter